MRDRKGEETTGTADGEQGDSHSERDRRLRTVVGHESVIVEYAPNLRDAFETFAESDHQFDDLDAFWRSVDLVFEHLDDDTDVDTCEPSDPASALVTVVSELDPESVVSLHDAGGSDELVPLLWSLKLDYDRDLERRLDWILEGRNWWRHVRSTPEERNGVVSLEHELTMDHTEDVVFHSTIESTWDLIDHLVWHVLAVPNVIGEETLLEMDTQRIGTIIGNLEAARADIEAYETRVSEEGVSEESDRSDDTA